MLEVRELGCAAAARAGDVRDHITPLVPMKIEPWSGSFMRAEQGLHLPRRPLVAVVPGHADGLALGVARAGEDVVDDGVVRPVVPARRRAFGADGDRRGQGERGEDRVEDVAAHVAERAGAEVEALAPVAGMVVAAAEERPLRGDAEPAGPS